MIQECEQIGKGLGEFLEVKRERFPRLYFLSNEEIVDIFGMDKLVESSKSTNGVPKRTYITNLFEGVETVIFKGAELGIEGIRSKENEIVKLIRTVSTERDPPDIWLKRLEG